MQIWCRFFLTLFRFLRHQGLLTPQQQLVVLLLVDVVIAVHPRQFGLDFGHRADLLFQLADPRGVGGDATVTLCHSRSADLPSITRQADILVAAVGSPRLVTAGMVKPGAAVIDVGINRIAAPDGTGKLVGDVDFDAVREVAGWISPVPEQSTLCGDFSLSCGESIRIFLPRTGSRIPTDIPSCLAPCILPVPSSYGRR